MAKTVVSDVIVPSVFEKYAIERTAELGAFARSGIIESDPLFDSLAAGGGQLVEMPFWQDLTAARQLLSGSAALTVNKIGATKDIARIHNDAQSWSVNHLAKALSGSDPMQAIVDLVGEYWARIDNAMVVAMLNGIFGAASMAGNYLNICSETISGQSASTRLNGSTFVDATAKLGDASERLVAVAMHSATEAALRKAELIDFLPDSEGKLSIRSFQGRRVVVDDGLAPRAGTTDGLVYRTYLFGAGAFAKGQAPLSGQPLEGGFGTVGVEMFRQPLDSDSALINRRRYILHPRGVKFTSTTCTGDSPTDVELATSNNWVRVYEAKNVRIVCVQHNN